MNADAANQELSLREWGTHREMALVRYNEEYEELLRNAEQIARNRIAANTRAQYNKANVNFVRWAWFYAKQYLKEEYIELFGGVYEAGQEVALMECIEKVVVQEERCPLNLNTFKAKVFFTYLLSYKTKTDLFFSYSCYDGKRSALMHLMSFTTEVWSLQEKEELRQLMQSLKNTILKQKQEKGLRTTEGKEAMSFSIYKLTCELCMQEGTKEAMFVLAWLTLQWNLISRSEATEQISFGQLKWSGDHLKVYFSTHKSDKLGECKEEPRHVYSNPIKPVVCPIRAIASYLMLFPDIVAENQKLFPGIKQRARNKDIYLNHGQDPSLLGTHSIHKGAATYCCAGVHPGPLIVSVCLRTGWTLGRVKERYLKYEIVGDELVGRTLTGIPPAAGEFGTSPAYFIADTNGEEFYEKLSNFMFPKQGTNAPLIRQMLATFIYHELFTVQKMNPASPLHQTSYFQYVKTDKDRFKYVRVSLPWENKAGCPILTDIPIHCALINQLLEIHSLQKTLPQDILKKLVSELDTRNIGDKELLISSKILGKIDQMTKRVVEQLEKIEKKDADNTPMYHESRVYDLTTTAQDATLPNSSDKTTGSVCMFPSQGIWQHYWEDKVRRVPQNFNFPSSKTLLSLWTSQHIPDFSLKICPWKYLDDKDYEHIKRGKIKYNEMRSVANELLFEVAKDEKLKLFQPQRNC